MKRFWASIRTVHGRSRLNSRLNEARRKAATRAGEPPVQPLEARQLLAADVVISELMHHAPTGDPGEEFVELYNRGDAPAFVGGWQFDQGVSFSLPAATIGADQYLVVAADVTKFRAKYPAVANVVGNWTGQLSNGGEDVRLVDNTGATVDKVSYADSGDYAVRRRGALDHGHGGWVWEQPADGQGPSLELINPALSNDHGANWTSSLVAGGTPGRANSVASADIAPMILDLAQTPVIPRSTDPVTVTLRVLDEAGAPASVELHYRRDAASPGAFNTVTMQDDGANGDVVAGDNVFAGTLPAQPDRTIVEFYASATDVSGQTRTWPGPTDAAGTQGANLLYQVDNSVYAGPQPIYRLVMTAREQLELADIGNGGPSGDEQTNAQMNATFVSVDGTGTEIRYQAGVRNRGHGSRLGPPNNYRVNMPSDHPLHGASAINFNVATVHSQVLGSAIYRLAGIEAPDATLSQVRVNGTALVANYVRVEEADGAFTGEHFPGDGNGSYYSAFRTDPGVPYEEADLRYEGANPAAYQDTYFKQTNKDVNDWSDLIRLTNVLNNTPDATFAREVAKVIDVPQWMRYLALDQLLLNNETGLVRGIGDDYGFYRGVNDPRFKLVPHDLDTLFNQGNSQGGINDSIFSNIEGKQGADGVDGLRKLLSNKEIIPQYYQAFVDLIRDVYNPAVLNPLIDRLLGPSTPAANIAAIKSFIVARAQAVLAQIPRTFTANSALPASGGYPRTTSATAVLNGTADSVTTHSVLVNGQPANWAPRQGTWSVGTGTGSATTLVPTGSTWKYLATTTDPGTAWRGLTFTDTTWPQATGRLGWGDGQAGAVPQAPVRTTTYFRKSFTVADPAAYSALTLRLLRDDGAVVYLNGQQVAISNLPAGPNYLTRPTAVVSAPEETQFFTFSIDPTKLRAGNNVLAVEVHDAVDSSDLSLDVGLDATVAGASSGGVPLNPGINRLVVQAFDGADGTGIELNRTFVDVWYDAPAASTAPPAPVDAVSLLAPDSYRPGTPILVQASALFNGAEQRELWDATVTLSTNRADVTLGTNQVTLRNGLGSALVTLGGAGVTAGGPIVLTATYGTRSVSKTLNSVAAVPVTTVSGTLSGATTWSGVVHVTGDVIIPAGSVLTINPGTLVLIDGVASGDQGKDVQVNGTIRSLGTAASPVVITAFNSALPWGELRHDGAQPSLYQYTLISRAGNSPGGGHTGKGPVLRPVNSKITFDHVAITDNVGKVAQADGSDLTFTHSELARSVAGAEIGATALVHEYTWTSDMRGTDDNDGIYLHSQRAGQSIVIRHSVFAGIDDDGIDTLGSDVLIDDVIVRDSKDKGVSTLAGVVTIRNSLLANNTLAPEDGTSATISAKAGVGFVTATVNLDHVTVVAPVVAIEARDKYGVPDVHVYINVTNSILIGSDAVRTDYPTHDDIHVQYTTLSEAFPGAGNVNADPMFTDATGHNYHLRPGSPALNSGDPASPNDPDGTRADMGFWRTAPVDAGPSATTLAAGPLRAGTTVLTPQAGVYRVTGAVVVPTGSTLQILPGTSLFFDPGASITVQNGGRLLAEGTQYNQIRFTLAPGAAGTWDGLQFVNSMSDNRITYAVIEKGGNATTNAGMVGLTNSNLLLDHDYFDKADHRRIRTENSSLIVRNSEFSDIFPGAAAPTTNNLSEHIWGNGVPAGGQFIIEGNVFGTTKGHNDAIDLGQMQRPGPIPQILNNLFKGGGDDALDLENDAHIEGNTFLHFRKDAFNTDPGNSNAMSLGGGRDYTVVRNTFIDVEHAALVKDGAFATFVNNTVQGTTAAAIYFQLPGDSQLGRGVFVDGSIFKDVAALFSNEGPATVITVNRSIVPAADVSRGTGNSAEDPRLANPAAGDVTLRPGSPAHGTGPDGLDMGAKVPGGAIVTGVPAGTTGRNSVSLTVGGAGITAYKYRLDGGAYGAETPLSTPLTLTGLSNGTHTLDVVGKNSAGAWQDADASSGHTWTVNTSLPTVRLSEVLAVNTSALEHGGFPDLIELYNEGNNAVDLSGMSISDDPTSPRKFVFPAGTVIQPGQYLTLYGDSRAVAGEVHVKFSLKAGGEGVYLYNTPGAGGRLVDSVVFGQQASDFSFGRLGDGLGAPWVLTRPTFGTANVAQRTGDPANLKINEWLADGTSPLSNDFIELYNPDSLPVSIGGLSLTDHIGGKPDRSPIAPLSFVGGGSSGFVTFLADGNGGNGADHTTFRLNADGGQIGLIDLSKPQYHGFVDRLVYGPQRTNVSQGRSPDGGPLYGTFNPPTPNAPNVTVAPSSLPLRITEIMYHPSDASPRSEYVDKDFEYVELQNTGAAPISLSGVKFTQGINFNFPDMTLQPGQYVLVVENLQAFQARYGTGRPVVGEFNGDLDDSGERLRLEEGNGSTILDFAYGDANWYPLTDGLGYSLVINDPAAAANTWGLKPSWHAGMNPGGSPGAGEPATASAAVLARHLFYNNSVFDGSAAPTADDDRALAPDKKALLPGATGTFANYSSYSKGINGIFIDVLHFAGTPTAADFVFKTGNGDDPSTWANAPAPTAVTIRRGAGDGGSDRITLTFADGAIKNGWLQVTVKPGGNTGLAAPDVFYFGNLVGETGDSATLARVNAVDLADVRRNMNSRGAAVTSRYDLNHDGRVNAIDLGIARSAQLRTSLRLLTTPGGAGAAVAAAAFSNAPITLAAAPAPAASAAKATAVLGEAQPNLLA